MNELSRGDALFVRELAKRGLDRGLVESGERGVPAGEVGKKRGRFGPDVFLQAGRLVFGRVGRVVPQRGGELLDRTRPFAVEFNGSKRD